MDLTAVWRPSQRMLRMLDVALIVAIVAIGWAGQIAARESPSVESGAFSVPLAVAAVAATLPLWWRRSRPLGMLCVTIGALGVAGAIDSAGLYGVQIALCGVVLMFAIGAWSTRRNLAVVAIAVLFGLIVAGAIADEGNVAAASAYGVALVVLPSVAGYAMRTRREYVVAVEQRLAAAEREREERAHRAVVDERHRIARELHDVIAHHVSLIGVQAGAARATMDHAPERARDALAQIEASSRAAVGEMRQLLDALAPAGADGVAPPQPSLEAVPTLIDRWRAAGIDVQSTLTGDPAGVAPTVSLCCYRVVEEALTNVARHSAARSAMVVVTIGDEVAVEVSDRGPTASAPTSSGRGLLGMHERVALCGGRLEAGPQRDGSFRVVAVVPAVPA
jgi:signal transduction histidine kinase